MLPILAEAVEAIPANARLTAEVRIRRYVGAEVVIWILLFMLIFLPVILTGTGEGDCDLKRNICTLLYGYLKSEMQQKFWPE